MSILATFISLIMCSISIKSTWRSPKHYRVLKVCQEYFCYRAYICTTEELSFSMSNEHTVPQAAIFYGILTSYQNKTVKRTPQNPEPPDHSEANDAREGKIENLQLVKKTNGVPRDLELLFLRPWWFHCNRTGPCVRYTDMWELWGWRNVRIYSFLLLITGTEGFEWSMLSFWKTEFCHHQKTIKSGPLRIWKYHVKFKDKLFTYMHLKWPYKNTH